MKESDKNMYRPERYEMKIRNDIYLIQKGVRSCCYHVFSYNEYDPITANMQLKDFQRIIKEASLYFFIKFDGKIQEREMIEEEYYKIYIYKYSHQYNIIQNIENGKYDFYTREYIIGKLLGYDDQSMEDFLKIHTNYK